jgi:FKBP-type peptidyl-prolyl cis-trans isomerase FklB
MIRPVLTFACALSVAACATVATPPSTPAGPDFLQRNAKAKHVVTTPSGMQYFIVTSGPRTGKSPLAEDTVTFDYEGSLTTGEVFDSSFARGEPLTGKVSGFVPGFQTALTMMRPGDEWIVWIPPELGYGADGAGPVPPNSVLKFRLALHSITPVPQP